MHDESFSIDCVTPRPRRPLTPAKGPTLGQIERAVEHDAGQLDDAEPFAEPNHLQFAKIRAFNAAMQKFWSTRGGRQ
jgi:hypothetical protein